MNGDGQQPDVPHQPPLTDAELLALRARIRDDERWLWLRKLTSKWALWIVSGFAAFWAVRQGLTDSIVWLADILKGASE